MAWKSQLLFVLWKVVIPFGRKSAHQITTLDYNSVSYNAILSCLVLNMEGKNKPVRQIIECENIRIYPCERKASVHFTLWSSGLVRSMNMGCTFYQSPCIWSIRVKSQQRLSIGIIWHQVIPQIKCQYHKNEGDPGWYPNSRPPWLFINLLEW